MRLPAAALMLALVLPPRMLPHPLVVDVAIGAIALLIGYTVGALLERLPWSRLGSHPRTGLAAAVLGAGAVRTGYRTHQVREAVGLPGNPLMHTALAVLGALTIAAGAVAMSRLSWRRIAVVVTVPAIALVLASARNTPDPNAKMTEFLGGATSPGAHRVYVPLDAATTSTIRTQRAVTETEKAGGLDSAAILVAVPTGSGWVNQRMTGALEQLYGGDLTTVVVQYSKSPSWLAFLRGGDGVRDTTSELVRRMRERIDRLPAGERPELLVYGESLGAWGLLPAVSDPSMVDAGLLVGVPSGHQTDGTGLVTLNHDDDPVPLWGLRFPGVGFWRTTADVVSSENVPLGHGHRYDGPETVDAWCEVLEIPACVR
ncbi:alpha/beta-hydrolase family protein [Kineosporia succinea]|uniref:Membrane protein n=1 Tax=Kineosporia succinea TaxID=84632 RepID=A0ABT9NXW0_9ACTN|nr:alpha/beta-hydrolase family protein [Kineosporia succinea]MDP9825274.1 putative membrane protein [Kineosporia succinea]